MSATFTAEKRRPPPAPPRTERELPVLFHLMDVSRPKGYAAARPPAYLLGPASEFSEHPGNHSGDRDGGSLGEFDLETAAGLVETKGFGSSPVESPRGPGPATIERHATGSESLLAAPLASDLTAPAGSSKTGSESDSSLAARASASQDDAVSLRQRAEERNRKRQATGQDDWFSTQGKYIAIGFVLAMIATIYFARTHRKPVATPVTATKAQANPGDVAQHAGNSAGKAATASAPATAAKNSPASPKAAITSVHETAKSAGGEPQAALHPPTIPQLARQPEGAAHAADENLFPWANRTEERVAVRTDQSPPSTSQPATPPAAAPGAAAVPPQASVPAMQPQYPTTNYRSDYQTVAPPGVQLPPGVQTPPAMQGPPAAQGPPSGATTGPAAAMPFYPTTNTARGTRYERTGSGLY